VRLADTSAWVEFVRDRDTRVADRLERAISRDLLATTEPVMMEVLAGARDTRHARRLRGLLDGTRLLPVGDLRAWEAAAAIYRTCRRAGFTPRSQLDCLVAAVAIREDVEVIHADRDFDEIARHTRLRVAAD
jgi:predicted nucleic acid-binding protein